MTGVEIATLAIAAAGLISGGVTAAEQHQQQKKGLREQGKAQQQAQAQSMEAQKQNAMAAKAARAKRPDIMELLAANMGPKLPSTVLSRGFGSFGGLGN